MARPGTRPAAALSPFCHGIHPSCSHRHHTHEQCDRGATFRSLQSCPAGVASRRPSGAFITPVGSWGLVLLLMPSLLLGSVVLIGTFAANSWQSQLTTAIALGVGVLFYFVTPTQAVQ